MWPSAIDSVKAIALESAPVKWKLKETAMCLLF